MKNHGDQKGCAHAFEKGQGNDHIVIPESKSKSRQHEDHFHQKDQGDEAAHHSIIHRNSFRLHIRIVV